MTGGIAKFSVVVATSSYSRPFKFTQPQATGYGSYVWPCALVLAQYLQAKAGEVQGKHMLEV